MKISVLFLIGSVFILLTVSFFLLNSGNIDHEGAKRNRNNFLLPRYFFIAPIFSISGDVVTRQLV